VQNATLLAPNSPNTERGSSSLRVSASPWSGLGRCYPGMFQKELSAEQRGCPGPGSRARGAPSRGTAAPGSWSPAD